MRRYLLDSAPSSLDFFLSLAAFLSCMYTTLVAKEESVAFFLD